MHEAIAASMPSRESGHCDLTARSPAARPPKRAGTPGALPTWFLAAGHPGDRRGGNRSGRVRAPRHSLRRHAPLGPTPTTCSRSAPYASATYSPKAIATWSPSTAKAGAAGRQNALRLRRNRARAAALRHVRCSPAGRQCSEQLVGKHNRHHVRLGSTPATGRCGPLDASKLTDWVQPQTGGITRSRFACQPMSSNGPESRSSRRFGPPGAGRFSGSRRAANAEIEPAQSCMNQRRRPAARVNRAIARQSSPIVVSMEQACHAGGRGFDARHIQFYRPSEWGLS